MQKDGRTLAQHYASVEEQTGKVVEEIMPFPDALDYVWQWFLDLHNARSFGMAANPITWPDMAAYFGLKQIRPHAWETDLIHRLDVVALTSSQKKPEETKAEVPKLPRGKKPHLRGKRKS